MNCLEAQALLSASHDGEPVAEAELAAAKSHCAECPECMAFADGLRYLDHFPVPPAPKGLTERIMEAVAPLAAERAEMRAIEAERAQVDGIDGELPVPETETRPEEAAALVQTVVPAAPESPAHFAWFAGPVRWATLGAAAALAASALIAFVVIGMNSGSANQTAQSSVGTGSTALDFTYGTANTPARAAGGAETQATKAPAPAQAPDYILYGGFVYAPGALLADANTATPTIGTVTTAFASGGTPTAVTVFRSPLTDGSIVVQSPDGMRVFTPVVRTLSSVRYQLTSAQAIDRFGTWPTLPVRFAAPTSDSGTPSFVTAGTDSLGVTVFSAIGRPVSEGFAVAPGTSTSDPAGGNPNWTWWLPAPANP
jgi:hypothetical protein